MIATIGYERATPEDFVTTLEETGIEILVDIRDRAQSRRKGFSKSALEQLVNEVGIEYVHIRELGDPKEGRDAARAGLIEEFKKIFSKVLASEPARKALSEIEDMARQKRICLMCYERNHHDCHRKMVSDELEVMLGCKARHLGVRHNGSKVGQKRRMLHLGEGATP